MTRRFSNRRKIVNEASVIGLMDYLNIRIIDIENFSFQEIVSVFNGTTHLISIHGAGLTNMIFMEKGSSVFELLLENTLTDKCYYFLANASELNYSYQLCKSKNDIKDHIYVDLIVDIDLLKTNLIRFLSS